MARSLSVMSIAMHGIPSGLLEQLEEMRQADIQKTVELVKEGNKLTLPKNMSLQDGIDYLKKKRDEEEKIVVVNEAIEAFPFDAAHSLMHVLSEMFGFTACEKTIIQGPFGPMTFEPEFIPVEIERDCKVQVPWGTFKLPGIEGDITTEFENKSGRTIFNLKGEVKGKHRDIVSKIAEGIRERLKTQSIYRGKAIKVTFRDREGKKIKFSPQIVPEFMNLECESEPIFTRQTEEELALSIFNHIEFTDRLRKNGMKLKRTVLLEGDYGTGKTLTAQQTARKCVKNDWTYVYVADCRDLDLAMDLAEQYAPAVVFSEDADRVMSGERDADMDALSYVLDGVDNKNRELLVVLTTNNVKKMQKLMIRPGRIDSVISIQKPDADTVWRLVQLYGKGILSGSDKEFADAIAPMIGQNAAFISEVVSKAKLRAISRSAKIKITPEDIRVAVGLMKNHVDLMNAETDENQQPVPIERLMVSVAPSSNGHVEDDDDN